MKRRISVWVYVLCVSAMIKAEIYQVTDFNVFPDVEKVNTEMIQKALEDYRDTVILDDVTGVTGHIAESSIDAH